MYRLGIDLGGTNIVAGVVNENCEIVGTACAKTNMPRPAEEIADDMARVSLEAVKAAGLTMDEISYMGIGTPGAVDPKNGVVCYAANLDFHNVNLAEMMNERLNKEFFVENDANAAAYGEYIAGAGRGTENFVAVTLGTGVGGGIIINGKLYSGSNYAGGELGHMVIALDGEKCTCGRNGCYEAYASVSALIKQTKQAMVRYPKSDMWQLVNGNIEDVNGLTSFNAMRNGDIAGKMVVDNYLYYVAAGISNIINIFQPDVICIGGGISKEKDTLLIPVREFVEGENFARNLKKKTVIKIAELGNDAGIIGAAFLDKLYK